MKGMDTCNIIDTDQEIIELENIIQTVCHLQDNNKQDVMETVETEKQVYLFYQ